MNLILVPGILEQMIEHATAAYPREGAADCCGARPGRAVYSDEKIFHPARQNSMEPCRLISVFLTLRGTGEQLIGIYHSHPHGPAEPSRKDIERAYYPEAAQLIVSLSDQEHPQTAAFRIIDGAAVPVEAS